MMRISYFSIVTIFAIMMGSSMGIADAELPYEKQVKFTSAVEQISAHILAARENIILGNSELSSLHLSHPILELYENLHTGLINNSSVDEKVEFSLSILENTNPNVNLDFFDMQTDEIIKVLDEAKMTIISKDTLNDPVFKLDVFIDLVEMSKTEYIDATESNNEPFKIVEIQDSHAFLMKAENILYSIGGMEQDEKSKIILKLQLVQLSILDNQPLNNIETQFDNIIDEIGNIDKSELVLQEIRFIEEAGLIEKQNKPQDFIVFEQSSIPSWIKINASWWADGKVSNIEFLSGIKYLLNENIIQVPIISTSYDGEIDNKIPSWIKQNASWWADGKVSDIKFLSGIEYMLERGILVV